MEIATTSPAFHPSRAVPPERLVMATPFPTVPSGDVWGQQLIDAITSRNTDTANAAGTDAQTKATTALNSAKSYVDGKVGASTLILGPQDAVPANTPAGTVIFRTT